MAQVLERGDIYFVYRPRVEEETVEGFEDVQRTYMILSPRARGRHRLIVLGQKRLPEARDGGQRVWGFVDKVGRRPEEVEDQLERVVYGTKTRGTREQPAARPAGEGVYAIVRHEDHTHLAYALELPRQPGAVQEALRIEPEGSYVLSVKNPEAPSPPGVGLPAERRAAFPAELQRVFHGRRFAEADPPELLDHEGAEVLLVGTDEDVSEDLGIRLDPQKETEHTAEIFTQLRLEKEQHPTEPLFRGEWR
jgi:hypothetical protein